MRIRATLRSPWGGVTIRDAVAGVWQEPSGDADETIGVGMWAVPGLADGHAHLAAEELSTTPGVLSEAKARAGQALDAGLTLVLDKGWRDDTTIRLIDEMPEAERPAIEAAECIVTVEDGYFPGYVEPIVPGDIHDVVLARARAGRGWVKLVGDWPRRGVGPVANFDEAQLSKAVAAAESVGARVAIHTMAREVPSMAVSAGVHSIEHGLFLAADDLARLGARDGMWVPTVLRVETTIGELGAESSGGRLLREGLARVRELLPVAFESGVHVLAGTDLVGAPADVAAEALRLIDYGLSPSRAVAAVAREPFLATGRAAGFETGEPADAVFFEADPLEEPGVLRHPVAVMRLGRLR